MEPHFRFYGTLSIDRDGAFKWHVTADQFFRDRRVRVGFDAPGLGPTLPSLVKRMGLARVDRSPTARYQKPCNGSFDPSPLF